MSPTEKTDARATGASTARLGAGPKAAGSPGASGAKGGAGSDRPAATATVRPAAAASSGGPAATPGSTASSSTTSSSTTSSSTTSSSTAGGASTAPPAAAASDAPRRVRLSLSRVNLWSVARLAFLLSVALGIIAVVAVTVLWAVLSGMGVFAQLDSVVADVVGSESDFRLADLFSLSRVLSVTVFLAVVDVVLITLIATIAALLYNLASGLVGGVRLTLSDD